MTDFDFEIIEVVAAYGEKGVTLGELTSNFKGYNLTYNLLMLSDDKAQKVNGISISFVNANVLFEKREYDDKHKMVYTPRYFVTDRGKALLINWQRQRKRVRRLHIIESVGWALLGATFGTILGQIANQLLNSP